jgi:type II secretory pathway pseudopilin PulG
MKIKKSMTLIEVMIAISLLILVTSSFGWKMHDMIAKKRFTSNVERLRSRLLTCRRIALNMQCDWRADIENEEKKTVCRASCIDSPKTLGLPVLYVDFLEFILNGEKINKISFDFTASGDIFPQGHLQIRSGKAGKIEWDLPNLFSVQEGNKLGPVHPEDLSHI